MSQQLRTLAFLAGAAFAGSALALTGADDPLIRADSLMAHPFMSSPASMTGGAQGRQAAWPGATTDAQAQAAQLLQHRWAAAAPPSTGWSGYADPQIQARVMIVGHEE